MFSQFQCFLLLQIQECCDIESLCNLLDSPEFLFRFECGCPMASSSLTIDDRYTLVKSIALHFVVYAQKAELDDIKRGLDYVLDFGKLTGTYPMLFRPLFFMSGYTKLRADSFLSLFEIEYSPRGSNRRKKEEVMMNFNYYIQELEGMMHFTSPKYSRANT